MQHGNVRELRNYIERYLAFREPPEQQRAELGAEGTAPVAAAPSELVDISVPYRQAKRTWIDMLERDYLTRKLAEHSGSVGRMAKAARLDRMYAYRLLRRLGIKYG